MSFEVYLQCFEQGQPAGISLSSVRALFPIVEAESEPDYWKVWYGESDWCNINVTFLSTDPTFVENMCVYRPCGDKRFWEAILAVMRLGPVALFFPGDAPALLASEHAKQQLPRDFLEAVDHKPRIVTSAEEILNVIRHA
jgi:hypothetical protein